MKNKFNKILHCLITTLLLSTFVGCGETPSSSTPSSNGGNNLEAPLVEFNLPSDYEKMEVSPLNQGGVMERFMKAKEELPDEITVLNPADVNNYPEALKNQIFVSPNGNDGKKGTKEAPMKTISAALKKLRGAGGGVLFIMEGEYVEPDGISLGEDYSGTEKCPLFITSYEGADVTVSGSQSVSSNLFTKVSETNLPSKLKNRLSDNAKENALCVNLYNLGFSEKDLGEFNNKNRPILNVDGVGQTVARYPNEGDDEIRITEVVEQGRINEVGSKYYETNKDSDKTFQIRCLDEFPYTWDEEDIWMRGLLTAQWDDRHYPVHFDKTNNTLVNEKNYSNTTMYEIKTNKECTYYLYNALEALDVPGEWYVDKTDGWLFYYPSNDFSSVRLCSSSNEIFNLTGVNNVVINGLTLTGSITDAIKITDGNTVLVQNCNIEYNGGSALYAYHCKKTGIIYSNITNNGADQVRLATKNLSDTTSSDTRINIEPEHNFVQNCKIIGGGSSAQNAININTVAGVVSHNYIEDGQLHVAGCIESVIEYNEVVHGSPNVEDSGFIYINGIAEYWVFAGCNHTRYNYLHDFVGNNSHAGIYLDDRRSGEYVYGNIVDTKCKDEGPIFGGKTSYRHHNGTRNVFFGNISIGATKRAIYDCEYLDSKYGNWESNTNKLVAQLDPYYTSQKFIDRYPLWYEYWTNVKTIVANNYQESDMQNTLRSPAYNVYQNNIIVEAAQAFQLGSKANQYGHNTQKDNLENSKASLTFDEGYVLNINMYNNIMNWEYEWEDVPFEKMGLSK